MTAASSTVNAVGGDGYELQMGRWSRHLAGPFPDFVGTAGGERVLDVRCGTGCVAFLPAQRCDIKELRGVDFSPACVEHATRHKLDPKLVFEVGDACHRAGLQRKRAAGTQLHTANDPTGRVGEGVAGCWLHRGG